MTNIDCSTCDSCEDTLSGLNSKLISIVDKLLYNTRYELNRKVDKNLFKLLTFYKTVLVSICKDENCDCYYTEPVPSYSGSSASELTIGITQQVFNTQSDLAYEIGDTVKITTTNGYYMQGVITDYYSTTMIVNVVLIYGSGTYCIWNLSRPTDCSICPSDGCVEPVNTGIQPAVVNHCICGCCSPLDVTCNFNKSQSHNTFTVGISKENIIERIKILIA